MEESEDDSIIYNLLIFKFLCKVKIKKLKKLEPK